MDSSFHFSLLQSASMKGLSKSELGSKASYGDGSKVSVKMRKVKVVTRQSSESSQKQITSQPPRRQSASHSKTPPSVSPRMRPRTNSCVVPPQRQQLSLPPQRERSSSVGQVAFQKRRPHTAVNHSTKKMNNDLSVKSHESSPESLTTHPSSHLHHHPETSANDLIFDYLHGEIKHKPKTAFGSIVHEEIQVRSSPKSAKKVSWPNDPCSDDDNDSADSETLTADNFLNQCIIESEQKCVKAAEKPHSSAAFDTILKEFMPEDDSETEQSPQPFRRRGYSLPSSSLLKTGNAPTHCGKKVQILSPEV